MTTYNDDNRGVLFRNESKNKESQPDYTGKAQIDGQTKRLAAWIRESKDGSKTFLSIAFEDLEEQTAPTYSTKRAPRGDDGAPF
jgi:uncharacterized protein (DUF736 family)